MHIEILTEDSSGKALLECLLPKIIANPGELTYRLHSYRGVGRIPKGLSTSQPRHRILLEQLPRILEGYGQTSGIDAVVVVLDSDRHDCFALLTELNSLVAQCKTPPRTLFRLAIEETEAWYLGDEEALKTAYPKCKNPVLSKYKQDSVCGTWELLADAIYPGGSAAVKKAGWPKPGEIKHEWAEKIGPLMDVEKNRSPSFMKLRDGVRTLVADLN
jgi:hypothetical protein